MDRHTNSDHRRYLLISPCRDEAKYMRRTLDSVVAQTVRPALWVIVDDGSTDQTPQILAEYAEQHEFIQVVKRTDRGGRSVGPGVIDAFYAGLDTVDLSDFDYLCKLDLDLDLPHRYFERLMEMMEAEPRLGTVSGKTYYIDSQTGQKVGEKIRDHMSIGASKFYRRTCFEQIGGFVRQVMWDGIDCHRARMLGWVACSRDEPDIQFEHLRPMGSSDKGILKGRMRHGYGQYFMGTGMAFVTASALFRLATPPVGLGSLAMWWGYVWAALRREARYDDLAFRRFLRRWQRLALIKGTARATAQVTEEQASVWEGNAHAVDQAMPKRSGSGSVLGSACG
jgi:glycosyltransferase involved in cell wall biosynthesis